MDVKVDDIGMDELCRLSMSQYSITMGEVDPSQIFEVIELGQKLTEVLVSLADKQAQILRLRYGLGGVEAKTQLAIGKLFGVTAERVRQIKGRALRELRHPALSKKLRAFVTF